MPVNPLEDSIYKERSRNREAGIRGDYFRDQTAIIHSYSFRRLKNKTQVFFATENDHITTRIEHVLHVASIARAISKGLNLQSGANWHLDEDLVYAIGLGHDIGHAPFGHAGEEQLDKLLKAEVSNVRFMHESHGYRVVEYLENYGQGLNLTFAVKDGIFCHCGESQSQEIEISNKKNDFSQTSTRCGQPNTYEGCVVSISDRIAYLGRDIDDARRANLISLDSLPATIRNYCDSNLKHIDYGKIINHFVDDVIGASENSIKFSTNGFQQFKEFREYNYKYIYDHEKLRFYKEYVQKIIETMYKHLKKVFLDNRYDSETYRQSNLKIDKSFGAYIVPLKKYYESKNLDDSQVIVDYIAGMSDRYALSCYKELVFPHTSDWNI